MIIPSSRRMQASFNESVFTGSSFSGMTLSLGAAGVHFPAGGITTDRHDGAMPHPGVSREKRIGLCLTL
jgi:hypothetical protein